VISIIGYAKINDDNFDQIISSNKNLLILFTSKNCGYCQIAKKNLNQVIDSFPEILVYECSILNSQKIVERYQVSSVPILKLFIGGKVVYTAFGIRESSDLYYQIKSFL